MKRIFSFDIFDTVLTRTCGLPQSVFELAGAQLNTSLLTTLDGPHWRARRERAETIVRNEKGGAEVTILEIYKTIQLECSWSDSDVKEAIEIEKSIEDDCLEVIPENARLISKLRKNGYKIIFISDMYWPGAIIESWLRKRSVLQTGDELFVSADIGLTKRSGELFRHVIKQYGIAPASITHIGNDFVSDYLAAKKVGLEVRHFDAGNLREAENRILRNFPRLEGEVLAGAARCARLHLREMAGASVDEVIGVSTGVASPILFAFGEWVCARALEDRVERIYFVTRDGFVLKKFVDIAIARSGANVTTHLIYGSRQAWHPVAYALNIRSDISWLFDGPSRLTIRLLFKRLGIDCTRHMQQLKDVGVFTAEDDVLSMKEQHLIRAALSSESSLTRTICLELNASIASTIGYLQQEGILEGHAVSLVDLGWSGRLHDSLNEIRRYLGLKNCKGMFLGLRCQDGASSTAGARASYLFSGNDSPYDTRTMNQIIMLCESFCTMSSGGTTGYTNDGTRWHPILRQSAAQMAMWRTELIHNSYDYFCRVVESSGHGPKPEILTAGCRNLLREFACRPTQNEASAWGEFHFEDDQSGGELVKIGRGQKLESLWDAIHLVSGGSPTGDGPLWLAASRLNTPCLIRLAILLLTTPSRLARGLMAALR